ncbi:carbohydrate-binding module family 14 protein [Nostoc sp. CHAB 5834]|nr:carbohydrate-binding module family 14 protein [Nostoc sp. CHAB 5834]
MKKLIKQIICGFIAIVVVIGLTTGSANAQSLNKTDSANAQSPSKTDSDIPHTASVPDYPCDPVDVDNLYPNPENRNSFYQCAPYGLVLMPCPSGLVFDDNVDRCEWATNNEY